MAWNAGPACAGISGRLAWNPQAMANKLRAERTLEHIGAPNAVRSPDLKCAVLDVAVRIPAPRRGFLFCRLDPSDRGPPRERQGAPLPM